MTKGRWGWIVCVGARERERERERNGGGGGGKVLVWNEKREVGRCFK